MWFLRNQNAKQSLTDSVKKFSAGISILSSNIDRSLPNHYRQDNISRAQPYIDQGVPKSLALHIANLVNLYFSCDIVNLASDRNLAVTKVAKIYFSIGSRFQLGHLRLAANNLNSEDHWTQLAISTLTEELYSHQLALTDQVIKGINRKFDERKIINDWLSQNKSVVGPTDKLLRELWLFEVNNISMVSVASRQIRSMIQKL